MHKTGKLSLVDFHKPRDSGMRCIQPYLLKKNNNCILFF